MITVGSQFSGTSNQWVVGNKKGDPKQTSRIGNYSDPTITQIQWTILPSPPTNEVLSTPVPIPQISQEDYQKLCLQMEENLKEVDQLQASYIDVPTMQKELANLREKSNPTSNDIANLQGFLQTITNRITFDNGQMENAATLAVNNFITDLTALLQRDLGGWAHRVYKSMCEKEFHVVRPNLLSMIQRIVNSTKASTQTKTLVALLAHKKIVSWDSSLLLEQYATLQVLLNSVPVSKDPYPQDMVPEGITVHFDNKIAVTSYKIKSMFIPPHSPMPGATRLNFVYMPTSDGDALVVTRYWGGLHILSYLKETAPTVALPTYLYTLNNDATLPLFNQLKPRPLCLIGSKAPHSIEKHKVAKARFKQFAKIAVVTGAVVTVVGAGATSTAIANAPSPIPGSSSSSASSGKSRLDQSFDDDKARMDQWWKDHDQQQKDSKRHERELEKTNERNRRLHRERS